MNQDSEKPGDAGPPAQTPAAFPLSGVAAGEALAAGESIAAAKIADETVALASESHPDGDSHGKHVVKHAMLVGLMTLLSRFTGLVRDSVQAAVLGLTGVADAFSIGFLVPNLFRRLFGEGALTAAFIPIYTELVKNDPALARRFASLCIALMLIVLGGITILSEAALAGLLASVDFAPDTDLAIRLTMIMLPYMPMVCIVALIGGVLQVHGKFGAPAAAPIFLNIVMIVGTLAAVKIAGVPMNESVDPGGEKLRHAVVLISYAVLVAGLVQLLWQIGMMWRHEPLTLTMTGAGPAMKRMVRMMVPMFIGLGVFQINTLADYLIAFLLSAKEGGAAHFHLFGLTLDFPVKTGDVAALQWAQRLYQFPLGVFGIAVATATFPAMSRAAAEATDTARTHLRTILRHGLRLTFFIGLPASAGLILLRVPITRLIYERGTFSLEDSQRVAAAMVGYSAAVWAYSMMHVLTRAFYAMKDARTPLRISLWMVALNVALNLALIWPMGVAGLAWSSGICAMLQVVLLLKAVRKYITDPIDAETWRGLRTTIWLTLAMTAALLPATLLWDATAISGTESALQLGVLLPIGMAIVLIGAKLLKADEMRWLVKRKVE